jgi:aspartyl-tRNA(Asn)/glutamyl-tRNA(Gln) amidotransferase subunit C
MPERDAPITPEEVAHVARLARLAIGDEELAGYTADLAAVLGHAADLAALDLAGVEPTAHPLPLRNVDRPDEVRPGLRREEALAGAPDVAEGRYFRVPRILGDDG